MSADSFLARRAFVVGFGNETGPCQISFSILLFNSGYLDGGGVWASLVDSLHAVSISYGIYSFHPASCRKCDHTQQLKERSLRRHACTRRWPWLVL